jgi:hypothetical protein
MLDFRRCSLKQLATLTILTLGLSNPAFAESFPRSGKVTHADSESEIDFGRRYIGFPDSECTFKVAKKLDAKRWRISELCNDAERGKNVKETAILMKIPKGWRYIGGGAEMDFFK